MCGLVAVGVGVTTIGSGPVATGVRRRTGATKLILTTGCEPNGMTATVVDSTGNMVAAENLSNMPSQAALRGAFLSAFAGEITSFRDGQGDAVFRLFQETLHNRDHLVGFGK